MIIRMEHGGLSCFADRPDLSQDAEAKALDACKWLNQVTNEAMLDAYRRGCKGLHIVRWQKLEANHLVWAVQFFMPNEEKRAHALVAKMQGTLETIEFKKAIPAEQLEQLFSKQGHLI